MEAANHWEGIRKDRRLRVLTRRLPEEARALVRAFTATMASDGKTLTAGDLDENEAKVSEVLGMAPKERKKWMRETRAKLRAAREGRNPNDVAQIKNLEEEREKLEAERDALAAQVVEEKKSAAQQRKAAMTRLRTAANELADAALEAAKLGVSNYSRHDRNHMIGSLDVIHCDQLRRFGGDLCEGAEDE